MSATILVNVVEANTIVIQEEETTVVVSPQITEIEVTLGTGPQGAMGPMGLTGPPGAPGSGDVHYVHTQNVADSTWTINHNLGRYPSGIVVLDSAGTVQFGVVSYPTINQVVVVFTAIFSGFAELI